jgi:hypothetical protein
VPRIARKTLKISESYKDPMTSISLTSGEILDVIDLMIIKEQQMLKEDNPYNAEYYKKLALKFSKIYQKLQDLPGEDRETTLVMAL